MNSKRVRVQIIGNYLEALERPLRRNEIVFENILNVCNPMAMEGDIIEENLKYCKNINHQPSLLNLRKNLSQMLSRDPENFCQNYNIHPHGKEVRYSNTSDYLILMHTTTGYALLEKDGVVYSDTYPQNQFITDIKQDKSYRVLRIPYHKNFNWRYYYDKFIDVVLSAYDSEHIILIRTNAAQWYMDKHDIKIFDKRSSHYRNMVEQMDWYFIERTNCLCIDEQYSRIPDVNINSAFPFAMSTKYAYKQYEHAILDIIKNQNVSSHRISVIKGTPLEQVLYKKLSSEFIILNSDYFKIIRDKWLTLDDISCNSSELSGDFFAVVSKLSRFLDDKNGYKLSDYAIELLNGTDPLDEKIDFELVAAYTKYMKLDINDVIAVYMLYSRCSNKAAFKAIAENIKTNEDCIPVKSEKKFKQQNIDYLKNYSYIQPDLLSSDDTAQEKTYIRLENNCFILLDTFSDEPMKKITVEIQNSVDEAGDKTDSIPSAVESMAYVDYKEIIENGYVCPITAADALCYSLAFYIERAKCGHGNKPVRLEFESADMLNHYLNFIDFTDILKNEPYVISVKGSDWTPKNHKVRCDLTFLTKENVKICVIRNGLNDKIIFYRFAKIVEEQLGGTVYYDNFFADYYEGGAHSLYELKLILKENIEDKLLTNLLTTKLLEYCSSKINAMTIPSILYTNGLDIVNFSFPSPNNEPPKCKSVLYKPADGAFMDYSFFDCCRTKKLSYFFFYTRPTFFIKNNRADISDYIQFSPFTDETNLRLQNEMMSCDAVVMHIRRGDYILAVTKNSANAEEEYNKYCKFYVEAIQKLLALHDYPNKKYFVFSDDIPWCASHIDQIGLNLVGDSDIYFVDHNKGDDSYKDMQLMVNAKIMIVSQSGFANTAALLSERCEVFMPLRGRLPEEYKKAGKKYKYDVEPFLNRGGFKNWI